MFRHNKKTHLWLERTLQAKTLVLIALNILGVSGTLACKGDKGSGTGVSSFASVSKDVTIQGAGATFQYPLMSKWTQEYNRQNPNVRINYQSVGSGAGIRQLIAGTVHFGSSDAPMTDEQLKEAKMPVLHIPVTLGAVAVIVNLKEIGDRSLRLDGTILADIFLGKITKWNDPKIAQINPEVPLPDKAIAVVHRSDGSGTTFIFADFLAKSSEEWRTKVGVSTSLNWPVGLGAKGNEGVSGQVLQMPYSIGYVELTYALQNKLNVAHIKNPSGEYVPPSLETVEKAATIATSLPEDLRVFITNADAPMAYPISSFSWVIVYRDQKDCAIATALARFLWWAVHDGQQFSAPLHYAPLPKEMVERCEQKIRQITCEGKPVL